MPKDLLCAKATWFENALKEGRFKEGLSSVIELPEDDPGAFEFFHYWVYHAVITNTRELGAKDLRSLVDLWVFADKYNLPRLQNKAIDQICGVFARSGNVDRGVLEYIGDDAGLADDSPVKILAADYIVAKITSGQVRPERRDRLTGWEAYFGNQGFARQLFESLWTSYDARPGLTNFDFPRYKQHMSTWWHVKESKAKGKGGRDR